LQVVTLFEVLFSFATLFPVMAKTFDASGRFQITQQEPDHVAADVRAGALQVGESMVAE
jgi:hypothetical protein